MDVEEGRLVEHRCPKCGVLEWRAFGEIESRHGELASYAIGWAPEHKERVGRMTVGIGAGNPGGASFHIDVDVVDGDWAMALVDQRFESVPEGGPDLTRDEALAHEDLRFIWFVADNVMEKDRRAKWMLHWLCGTTAVATRPVVDGQAPVKQALRDEDGEWELYCGTTDLTDGALFHLHHAFDRDQSLLDVVDLEPGERAERRRLRGWKRSKDG